MAADVQTHDIASRRAAAQSLHDGSTDPVFAVSDDLTLYFQSMTVGRIRHPNFRTRSWRRLQPRAGGGLVPTLEHDAARPDLPRKPDQPKGEFSSSGMTRT